MTPELAVWLVVSLAGSACLPLVWRRRTRESAYHKFVSGNGVRGMLLSSREKRAWVLSVGVMLSAGVALVTWLFPPSEARRLVSVAMLIGVEVCLVAALWLDEWYAERIDRVPRREDSS